MLLTISEYDEKVTGETERLMTSSQLSIKSANSTLPVSDVRDGHGRRCRFRLPG